MKKEKKKQESSFDPTLSQGIIAILIVLATIIIVLSFFGKAGTIGVILDEWILNFLFGKIRYITPFITLAYAWFMVAEKEKDYKFTHVLGALLLFFTIAGAFHATIPADEMWNAAVQGSGAGMVGMIAWPIKNFTGAIATYAILFSMLLISFLLIFDGFVVTFVTFLKNSLQQGFRTFVISQKKKKEDKEMYEDSYEDDGYNEFEEEEEEIVHQFSKKEIGASKEDNSDAEEEDEDFEEEAEGKAPNPKVHQIPKYAAPVQEGPWSKPVIIRKLPPINLLSDKKGKPTTGDLKRNAEIIHKTFEEFGIHVDMGEARVGPTVTQFTCKPAKGVKVSRITSLTNDLALALAAHPIRIEAPIPGKSLIGIEVPNTKAALVTLRELLESKSFRSREHNLSMGLGRDVGGKVWFAGLPKMPHLLIAGSTGSGKTVCMNTIILSLLYQNTAETLRMIMVDPKRVELTPYNGIPHLLTPVITNPQKTVNALKWTIGEMDRRFELLSKAGNRNINTYNESHPDNKLPFIVFIIDELADLMALAANEVETGIIRLAQMARAVGIHLIVATQRPSVDVITGLMKANIPARIAFSVASLTDSRTILDSPGAEKLLGRGDMLFQTADLGKPMRIQGAFVSEKEMKDIIDYLKGDEEPEYDESIVGDKGGNGAGGTANMFGGADDGRDALFEDAKKAVIEAGKASASFLQRRLKVGYARAARIIDELEDAGIVGPADGAKAREIYVDAVEAIPTTMDAGGQVNAFNATVENDSNLGEAPSKEDTIEEAAEKLSSHQEEDTSDDSEEAEEYEFESTEEESDDTEENKEETMNEEMDPEEDDEEIVEEDFDDEDDSETSTDTWDEEPKDADMRYN